MFTSTFVAVCDAESSGVGDVKLIIGFVKSDEIVIVLCSVCAVFGGVCHQGGG